MEDDVFFWRVNFAIRLPPLSFEAKSTLSQVVFPRQKAQPFPLKNHQQIHSKSKKYDYNMKLSFASPQQMFPFFPNKVPIFPIISPLIFPAPFVSPGRSPEPTATARAAKRTARPAATRPSAPRRQRGAARKPGVFERKYMGM